MGGVRPDEVERPTELVDDAPPTVDAPREPAAPPLAGTALGRYVAIEESGRGGMGSVIRAYDPKLQREVALKRLHTSRMTDDARARLVREARAMAQLGHPNVVAVFDVETGDDFGVMVVMEYVAGATLRTWLRAEPREWREIVEVFGAAGRGLSAAHAVGLLHRDFKPGNVLVSEDPSGERRVRVTDFGLARPPRHTEETPDLEPHAPAEHSSEAPDASLVRGVPDGLTEELTSASVVMGTPTYMAPEQHAGSPLTVAADQFAFCVSLWEAITGRPPFVGRTSELKTAKAKGPPPWPRDADAPRRVIAALRRGLAAAPDDRWPSMDALLHELTAVSQAGDRRKRIAAVATAGSVVIVGVLLLWPSSERPCSHAADQLAGIWDADRRARTDAAIVATALPYAESTAARVGDELDAYARAWIEMHTDACEATSVRQEQSAAVLDVRMSCLQRAKLELAVAADMLEQADVPVVDNADRIVAGLAPLTRCADVDALLSAVAPPLAEQAEAVEHARSGIAQVRALLAAGKPALALARIAEVDDEIAEIDYAPLRTEAALERGRAHAADARYSEAVTALQSVVRDAPALHQWDEAVSAATHLVQYAGDRLGHPEAGLAYLEIARGLAELASDPDEARLRTRIAFGAILIHQGRYEEAERTYDEILRTRIETRGEDHPSVALARAELARAQREGGRLPEAEREFRLALAAQERTLGPEHPVVANIRNNLAGALTAQGKYAEAEAELQRILELRIRVLGADHLDNAATRINLAEVFYSVGRYADAERELELALAARIATLGERHPDVADVRNNLAGPLLMQLEHEEAESQLRAALAIWEASLGAEHPDVALARGNLASLLIQRAKDAEAVALLRSALPIWERALGPGHPHVALGRANLARGLQHLGVFHEAERELRTALADQIATFGEDHVEVAATRQALASTLADEGEWDEAISEARAALASFVRSLPPEHSDVARAQRTLGRALFVHGDIEESIALLESAFRVLGRDDAVLDDRAGAAFDLARALWSRRSQRERALELARGAVATWSEDGQDDRAREVEAWLRAHAL